MMSLDLPQRKVLKCSGITEQCLVRLVCSCEALFDSAGLAQSIERLTAEREVAGSIPGTGPILRVLKELRKEGTAFALQTAGPCRGSDDHLEMAAPSPVGDVKNSVPN